MLPCMVHVDLNPIRVDIAQILEKSDFTSIQLCIKAAIKGEQSTELLAFTGNEHKQINTGICFSLQYYLTLVDETGRVLREDKRDTISSKVANILIRLQISHKS